VGIRPALEDKPNLRTNRKVGHYKNLENKVRLPAAAMVEFVFGHLAAEGVAMDTEDFSGA
jgi:hypothetical protein